MTGIVVGISQATGFKGSFADLNEITAIGEPAPLEGRDGAVRRYLEHHSSPVASLGRRLGDRKVDIGGKALIQIGRAMPIADASGRFVRQEAKRSRSEIHKRASRNMRPKHRCVFPRSRAFVGRIDIGLTQLNVWRVARQHEIGAMGM